MFIGDLAIRYKHSVIGYMQLLEYRRFQTWATEKSKRVAYKSQVGLFALVKLK